MNETAVYDVLARSTLVHEYEDAFRQATGLSVEFIPSGEPAQLFSHFQRENPFCSLMAQFAGSCMACQQAHAQLQVQIADSLAPQMICCFAGLAEFAVPVVVGEQHIATLMGGQVFQCKPTPAQFAKLTRQLHAWGMDRKLRQVETAFFQIHVISRKKFQASVRLLTIFARLLAEDLNHDLLTEHVQDRPYIARAKNFILAHASEPLRLIDVAEHVHVSTNYFCKCFKKSTGIGFSEFVTRVRVERAKDSLADPILPINEIANQAGFGSLSQFNRAFHRYAGSSPTAYRASLLAARSS